MIDNTSEVIEYKVTKDKTLTAFRTAVYEAYSDRVERIILYGSRARGDARPDSDYDVAIFFRHDFDLDRELFRLADISTAVLEETDEVIHVMPFRVSSFAERTPLMHEIRRSGIDL